jgi:hypothetical protein
VVGLPWCHEYATLVHPIAATQLVGTAIRVARQAHFVQRSQVPAIGRDAASTITLPFDREPAPSCTNASQGACSGGERAGLAVRQAIVVTVVSEAWPNRAHMSTFIGSSS